MRRFQWLLVSACGLGLLGAMLWQLPASMAVGADNPSETQAKQAQDQAKQAQEKQNQEKQSQEQGQQTQQKPQEAHQMATQHQESRDLSYGMNAAGQIRANKFVGTEVRSRDGEKIGDIEDITFDLKSGRVLYVAVATGGFLGIDRKLVAVPWKSLQLHGGEGERSRDRFVVLNVSKDEFRNAPSFASDAWPISQDQVWQVGTEHEEMDTNVERQQHQGQHSPEKK